MSKGKLILIVLVLVIAGAGAYYVMGPMKAQNSPNVMSAAGTESTGTPGDAVPGEFWTKRCNEGEPQYCEIFQRLVIKENNQRLLELAVGYPEGKESAQAVMILPLGITVAKGILLAVDEDAANKAEIRSCNQDGCFVVMELPDSLIDTMKTGKTLTVGFLDGNGKQVNVGLSLEGFATKLAEVSK